MKSFVCPVCDNRKHKFFLSIKEYSSYQCTKCSFIYIFPRPSETSLRSYYSRFDYKNIPFVEKRIKEDSQISLDFINHYRGSRNSLLDLGCGRGYFLLEAASKGWKVKGVDFSSKEVAYATKKLNLDVVKSDILKYQDKNKYELIVLSQVIEHVRHPSELIKKTSSLLTENGLLYIATPNINSASAKIHGKNFEHLIPPEHLNYFNSQSLTYLLNHNGFRVIKWGTWGYPENVSGIIKKLLRRGVENNAKTTDQGKGGQPQIFQGTRDIKIFMFDKVFCTFIYKSLDLFNLGINLHVLAQKI
jgi:2-polyprenyl-3-methyl-5-hydroxy-6-metoxy-1,4-benzoquinol methylase/rubredoxin